MQPSRCCAPSLLMDPPSVLPRVPLPSDPSNHDSVFGVSPWHSVVAALRFTVPQPCDRAKANERPARSTPESYAVSRPPPCLLPARSTTEAPTRTRTTQISQPTTMSICMHWRHGIRILITPRTPARPPPPRFSSILQAEPTPFRTNLLPLNPGLLPVHVKASRIGGNPEAMKTTRHDQTFPMTPPRGARLCHSSILKLCDSIITENCCVQDREFP
jgi:hypothetical protein